MDGSSVHDVGGAMLDERPLEDKPLYDGELLPCEAPIKLPAAGIGPDFEVSSAFADAEFEPQKPKPNSDQANMTCIKSNVKKINDLGIKHFCNAHDDGDDEAETSANDTEESPAANDLDTESAANDLDTDSVGAMTEDDGWLYLLGHKQLRKKILKAGAGVDTRPIHGDLVTVSYVCRMETTGQEVDRNTNLKFALGEGDVIQALDIAVALMELNEYSTVVTDARYAYGDLGKEPNIPGNVCLTYDLQLIHIQDAPDYTTLPVSQIIEFGDLKRERGNFLYARNEHSAAINSYSKALAILTESEGRISESCVEFKQLNEIKLKCFNNLAAAQLKVEAWDVAIKSCESVLIEEPENTKALFRKGKCLAGKGEISEAIYFLRQALQLEPESKLVHQELFRLVTKQREDEHLSRIVYQRMMGTQSQDGRTEGAKLDEQASTSEWIMYIIAAALVAGISLCLATYFSLY